ncbi:hypothetical protein ACYSNV_04030 [Myroides sp. LJL119]
MFAKFTLPEQQKQIIASQYKLYLPTQKQLLEQVKKELESFKSNTLIYISYRIKLIL